MSFSLHSSTENFGGGRRSSSSGSNSSSSWRVSVKSLIGRDVAEGLREALLRNHSKLSRWIGDQVRQREGSSMFANDSDRGWCERVGNALLKRPRVTEPWWARLTADEGRQSRGESARQVGS